MLEPSDIPQDQTLPDQMGGQSNAELAKIYATGDIVGGTYRLKELIGKGGMGYVFCAEHTIIGQEYALKLLAPDKINETNWRRFQSEGKAIAKLNHQNVVHIYNMGVDREQCPFYVMDLLYGASLEELVFKTGPVKPDVAIEIFLQLCRGLAYAHHIGVIHRDIKPSNIILQDHPVKALENKDSVPVVKIVDFGLAKLIRIHGDSLQRITNTGQVFGTPFYMSPEQCMGGVSDARSDIYSLGCTFYEILTGQPPFCGQNAMETVLMHMDQEPLRLSQTFPQGGFSQSIELLVAKMLKKDPAQRYQTVDQVAHDLERIKHGKVVVQPLSVQERSGGALDEICQAQVNKMPAQPESAAGNGKETAAILAALALLTCLGCWVGYDVLHPRMQDSTVIGAKSVVRAVEAVEDLPTERDQLRQAFAALPNFSRGVRGRERIFQFSDQYPFGQLHWEDDRGPVLAKGTVAVPADKAIELVIDGAGVYELEKVPEILTKFDANDISALRINSSEWPTFLRQVTGWNTLNQLTLNKSTLASKDLPLIDALSHLNSLSIQNCDFDPLALAQLKVLPRLQKLALDSGRSVDETIKAVRGSKNIRVFSLETWPCTPLTLSYLAQCPNMTDLHLSAENLRDQDILILEKMPNLQILHLKNTKLTPNCVGYLRRLRSLKLLVLEDLRWSRGEKDRLKKEVPAYCR